MNPYDLLAICGAGADISASLAGLRASLLPPFARIRGLTGGYNQNMYVTYVEPEQSGGYPKLLGGLEHEFLIFPSSWEYKTNLTNSYFSRELKPRSTTNQSK